MGYGRGSVGNPQTWASSTWFDLSLDVEAELFAQKRFSAATATVGRRQSRLNANASKKTLKPL